MEERRDRSMCKVIEIWKNIMGFVWVVSRVCGRRGDWRGRVGFVGKEFVRCLGIWVINWKMIWLDVNLDLFNSKVEGVLKISD